MDFQAGDTNFYFGEELEECESFPLLENSRVDFVRLTLRGIDRWLPEWTRVVFNDHSYVECANKELLWLIEDGQSLELPCT
jgi:hypothetical protein